MAQSDGAQCPGWPDGYPCPVLIEGRQWCRGCTARRQEAIARGLPAHSMTPVATVLQDFAAPELQCLCGGDARASLHQYSLRHMEWSWKRGAEARRRVGGDYRKYAEI